MVTLADHCRAVGKLAARFATAIGLRGYVVVRSLELAGLLHDLGSSIPGSRPGSAAATSSRR